LYASTSELIAAACLRRIRSITPSTEFTCGTVAGVTAQLRQMIRVVAEEPGVAAACAAVFVGGGAVVGPARHEIRAEIHRHIAAAVGAGGWPEVVRTL